MVFQDPDDQLFMPTVYEDVAFGPLNLGSPARRGDRRPRRAWTRVGRNTCATSRRTASRAGEKRAVAIATVLSMSPDILVHGRADLRPGSPGAPATHRALKEFQHTRVIATHDLDMVLEVCDRTIVLREGTVDADGPTLEIFSDEALLADCRLEKPLSMQGCPICGVKG